MSHFLKAPIKATDVLTIALNDIWASEVLLKELNFEGNNYKKKMVTAHFGLLMLCLITNMLNMKNKSL